eukprot:2437753-Rhodomonas_salina.2
MSGTDIAYAGVWSVADGQEVPVPYCEIKDKKQCFWYKLHWKPHFWYELYQNGGFLCFHFRPYRPTVTDEQSCVQYRRGVSAYAISGTGKDCRPPIGLGTRYAES